MCELSVNTKDPNLEAVTATLGRVVRIRSIRPTMLERRRSQINTAVRARLKDTRKVGMDIYLASCDDFVCRSRLSIPWSGLEHTYFIKDSEQVGPSL